MNIVAFPAFSAVNRSPRTDPRRRNGPVLPPRFLLRSNARAAESATAHTVSPLFPARPWLQDDPAIELGWDHARYALRPSLELMGRHDGLKEGYRAGVAVFARRTLRPNRFVKAWLALRLEALERGCFLDAEAVNPRYIEQLVVSHCPVTRQALELGRPDTLIVRLRHDKDYVAGNLVMMSRRAWLDSSRSTFGSRLDAADKARLKVLRSFGLSLPHASASRLPLAVMPANRLHVRNPIQALQAVTSRMLSIGNDRFSLLRGSLVGKSALDDADAFEKAFTVAHRRELLRSVGSNAQLQLQTETETGTDAGAQAPATAGAAKTASATAAAVHAIEDAWLHDDVLRAWQALASHLDADKAERLCGMLASDDAEGALGFEVSVTPDDDGLPPQRASRATRSRASCAA